MNQDNVLNVLNDWNFWRNSPPCGVLRPQYVNALSQLLTTGQVVVITGSRRAGKSFLMRQLARQLIDRGTPKEEILMVNLEDPRLAAPTTETLSALFTAYRTHVGKSQTPYLFLDEIQVVKQWEKWVRMMHELRKATIIISGSNADLLSQELATVLTGRHVSLTVFPLALSEQLSFQKIPWESPLDRAAHAPEIQRVLGEQLEFGGFPQVVLSAEKQSILLNYFDDIVTKDLVRRFRVRKVGALKKLAHFYLAQPASPVTFNAIEKFLEMSADTIEKFSGYFEIAYLFMFLTRFSAKAKERVKSPRKVYPIDTGLASCVGMRLSQNMGQHAETLVFLDLLRSRLTHPQREIFYWKDVQHWEVDFVVKDGLSALQLIQVCWDLSSLKTQERETRALWKAMHELQVQEGLILTRDREDEETQDGRTIRYTPIWKWMLDAR